jgi:hypothetical protein
MIIKESLPKWIQILQRELETIKRERGKNNNPKQSEEAIELD